MLEDLLLILASVVAVAFLASAIKVVPEYKRLVILRLGRFVGIRGPGIVLRLPIVDRLMWIDLREDYFTVPHQTCITKDNAPTDIDFIVYYRVVDPAASVLNVSDFRGAAIGIATTTLRAVIGEMVLDEVLAKRDYINNVLRVKLDEVTERWGVKITNVEIREILPPKPVQEAMIKQMAAERNRRAMVTEAEGKKESAIRVAEGEKQAAILRAEGDRQAAILRAEGLARALQIVSEAAREVDPNTMKLQYLEAIREVGRSPATKIVLPLEVLELIRGWLER
ncbi:MAG: SPFH/Band 7/PHB domain protein [Thermoproteota archaeon]|nr:MAG: SPFH/Band 7/PHB domain protein [Candidatus Korarchaeota archaeon]